MVSFGLCSREPESGEVLLSWLAASCTYNTHAPGRMVHNGPVSSSTQPTEHRTHLACLGAGGGAQGKNPIAGWKISGTKTAKKVYDKSVKSYVYCCVGGPTNKMQLPNDSQTSTPSPPAPPGRYPPPAHLPTGR
jgi:hypothetical protein